MAGASQQKRKLFLLYQLLLEHTDEKHPMTVRQLSAALEDLGIRAERKSICGDLRVLSSCGLDIRRRPGRSGGFFLARRVFGPMEIRLLMDAVRAAAFIPPRKSRELTEGLARLASRFRREALAEQVFVGDPVKEIPEETCAALEAVGRALEEGRTLRFAYPYAPGDQPDEAPRCTIIPRALVWADGMYYLLGVRDPGGAVNHYRIDRMAGVCPGEPSPPEESGDDAPFDAEGYVRSRFSMISGREEWVLLRFHRSLRDRVTARFGAGVSMRLEGDDLLVTCSLVPGSAFMGWMFSLGGEAEILEPLWLRRDMIRRLAVQRGLYGV